MQKIFEIQLDRTKLENCVLLEKEGSNIDDMKVPVVLNLDTKIILSNSENLEIHDLIERLATLLIKGHKSYLKGGNQN